MTNSLHKQINDGSFSRRGHGDHHGGHHDGHRGDLHDRRGRLRGGYDGRRKELVKPIHHPV